MNERVRVGIVGCGMIAPAYVRTLRCSAAVDLVACSSRRKERAERFAEEHQIAIAMTPEELLGDPTIEVVVNLTPVEGHADVTLRALSGGKAVYSEKPLGRSLSEGQAICEAVTASGGVVACAPDSVMGGPLQECRNLIEQGAVGEPIAAVASGTMPPVEHRRPDPEGSAAIGPWMDLGPYALTALVELLGPIARVYGRERVVRPQRTIRIGARAGEGFEITAPNVVTGVLETESGVQVSIFYSSEVWSSSLPRLEIYGTDGTLRCTPPGSFGGMPAIRRASGNDWENVPVRRPLTSNTPHGWRGVGAIDLAFALRAVREPRAALDVAFHVLEVLSGLETSASRQGHVDVESRCRRPEPVDEGIEARLGILEEVH